MYEQAKVWVSKNKSRVYESLHLSTMLYEAETWPVTVANMKQPTTDGSEYFVSRGRSWSQIMKLEKRLDT